MVLSSSPGGFIQFAGWFYPVRRVVLSSSPGGFIQFAGWFYPVRRVVLSSSPGGFIQFAGWFYPVRRVVLSSSPGGFIQFAGWFYPVRRVVLSSSPGGFIQYAGWFYPVRRVVLSSSPGGFIQFAGWFYPVRRVGADVQGSRREAKRPLWLPWLSPMILQSCRPSKGSGVQPDSPGFPKRRERGAVRSLKWPPPSRKEENTPPPPTHTHKLTHTRTHTHTLPCRPHLYWPSVSRTIAVETKPGPSRGGLSGGLGRHCWQNTNYKSFSAVSAPSAGWAGRGGGVRLKGGGLFRGLHYLRRHGEPMDRRRNYEQFLRRGGGRDFPGFLIKIVYSFLALDGRGQGSPFFPAFQKSPLVPGDRLASGSLFASTPLKMGQLYFSNVHTGGRGVTAAKWAANISLEVPGSYRFYTPQNLFPRPPPPPCPRVHNIF